MKTTPKIDLLNLRLRIVKFFRLDFSPLAGVEVVRLIRSGKFGKDN